MIVVNLFGAPGAGKSTGASYIFSSLKMLGVNAELVTEFAKDMTWESNSCALSNQVYVLGNQLQRMYRCQDKVDVIITDSPLLLNVFYNENPILGENYKRTVLDIFNSYNNINYFVSRVKRYNPIGRNQTEQESDELAIKIKKFLTDNEVNFTEINGSTECYDSVVECISKIFLSRGK